LLRCWRSDEWLEQADLDSQTYAVSDLWDLVLGLLFVIVVMMLPNGIVGTWNKWRIERRIRRMEKELRRESS
jgi:ABC-type branched-subunit amino acid transport system permease subunit